MSDELSASPRQLAAKLLDANPPLEDGIVPGSTRDNVTHVNGVTGSRLTASRDYKVTVQELDEDHAMLGNQTELVLRCIAKKADGSDVLQADDLRLREEAPTLLWRRVQLEINKTVMNPCERSDVVRHTIDRLFTNVSDRTSGETGPLSYRQINNDTDLLVEPGANGTNYYKTDAIQDGREFELIRPLTDLPLMGPNDGIIPGFNSVVIHATVTSKPQNLFVTNTPGTIDDDPYLEIVALEVRTRTVRLLPTLAATLQQMANANELEMNADTWIAQEATPTIAAGATTYQSGPSIAFGTTPDVIAISMFKEETFEPSEPSFEGRHPLLQSWNSVRDVSLTQSGECIKSWKGLTQTVQPAFSSLNHSFETAAGAQLHTLAPYSKYSSVNSKAFTEAEGTGSLVFAYRNWGEKQSHMVKPLSLRINATFENSSERAIVYLVSKTRHRWNISLMSKKTMQVL